MLEPLSKRTIMIDPDENKEIYINDIKTEDMINYIEKYHPADKKSFATKVFEKSDTYNHFTAKNIFLKTYFPESLAKSEKERVSDKLLSWLD